MKSTRLVTVLAIVVLAGCQPAAETAEGIATDSDARISRIAAGVTPAFVIDGEEPAEPNLTTRMRQLNVPAVSMAFFEKGEVEWARAWGMADVTSGTSATPETLFQAASISKPVAAMAALALVDEGLLHLDAPVNDLLTSWQVPDNELTAASAVTLRGLVTHTAGTTVHGFGGYPAGAAVPDTVGVLEGAGNSDPIIVDLEPRTQWRYSGGGYTVMQLLVEDVTGKPFADFAQERVLGPLGMDSSAYAQPLPEEWAARTAVGYRSDGTAVEGRWHTYPELAAAGLWTTPSDLARWAIAIQGAADGEHPVLSSAMVVAMLTPDQFGHGLGPALRADNTFFGHGGANEGYRSTLQAEIEGGQGVAIMTNADSGGQLVNELLLTVAREYGWAGFEPRRLTPIELTAEQLAEYAGTYVADEPWRVTIEYVDGKLLGRQSWEDAVHELVPDGEDHFFVRADGSGVQFTREAGDLAAVDVQGFRFTRREQD